MINRSIHSLMFMLIVLILISVFKIVNALLLIMKSIELLMSCIHLIFVIFRRSYDYRKLMTLIMKRFFWIVSNLTRQSYNDLKSMHEMKDTNRSRIANNVALRTTSRSKSWTNAYNSAARTLRVTRLHLIDDQWTMLTCFESTR
jgi:NADH:ubiquinone oxidoreductase subunit K